MWHATNMEHFPDSVEQGVQRFADELHISHDEAVLRLIQRGLTNYRPDPEVPRRAATKRPGELLIGLFSGPEDRAVFDDAMRFSRELREKDRLRDVWE